MTTPSKRELHGELEALSAQSDPAATDVTVGWREAAPDDRPDGIAFDPDEGALTYDIWQAQRDVLAVLAADVADRDRGDGDEPIDIAAFLGGYGAGKSILGARWLIAQALAHPESRFLALGIDFTKARDATFRVLFEQLPGERTAMRTGAVNGPAESPIVADYNHTEYRLTLTNGTEITLGSADQWNRYAGTEYGGIWLDEPSHYECDLHNLTEMLGGRLRGVPGPKTQLWTLTGNGYNDAWEILEQRQDTTGDPIGLNIELVRASTLDNPYLDAGTTERFERQYGDTAREAQALHGSFAAAQGLVYTAFSRETHVIPHAEAVERVEEGWRVYGYDAGWKDPLVILEIGKTPLDQLVVVDELYETGYHIEDAITWLNGHDKPAGKIYCEHEPAHIEKFGDAGYSAKRATKDLDEGITEVRKRLEADGNMEPYVEEKLIFTGVGGRGPTGNSFYTSRADGRDPGADPPEPDEPVVGLLVSDNCQHLIREFLGYKEDHVGSASAIDHCLDALRYACMGASTPEK